MFKCSSKRLSLSQKDTCFFSLRATHLLLLDRPARNFLKAEVLNEGAQERFELRDRESVADTSARSADECQEVRGHAAVACGRGKVVPPVWVELVRGRTPDERRCVHNLDLRSAQKLGEIS